MQGIRMERSVFTGSYMLKGHQSLACAHENLLTYCSDDFLVCVWYCLNSITFSCDYICNNQVQIPVMWKPPPTSQALSFRHTSDATWFLVNREDVNQLTVDL